MPNEPTSLLGPLDLPQRDASLDDRLAELASQGLVTLRTRDSLTPIQPIRSGLPSLDVTVLEDREDRL